MQRKGTQGDRDQRDEDELQEPENAPIFLTARELQSPDPGKSPDDDAAGEREDRSERIQKKERDKPKSG